VSHLHQKEFLDISVIHGDGTTTAAKKGGDNLGFSGHKHCKGDKVVAFCDRNCNVIAPFIAAPGNCNESRVLNLSQIIEKKFTHNLRSRSLSDDLLWGQLYKSFLLHKN